MDATTLINWEEHVVVDATVCGGEPCVKGTRIPIAVLLDGLAEGLSRAKLIDHYPQISLADIGAALAYAAELARGNVWRITLVADWAGERQRNENQT